MLKILGLLLHVIENIISQMSMLLELWESLRAERVTVFVMVHIAENVSLRFVTQRF